MEVSVVSQLVSSVLDKTRNDVAVKCELLYNYCQAIIPLNGCDIGSLAISARGAACSVAPLVQQTQPRASDTT